MGGQRSPTHPSCSCRGHLNEPRSIYNFLLIHWACYVLVDCRSMSSLVPVDPIVPIHCTCSLLLGFLLFFSDLFPMVLGDDKAKVFMKMSFSL